MKTSNAEKVYFAFVRYALADSAYIYASILYS